MMLLFGAIVLIIGVILFLFGGEDSKDLARIVGIKDSKDAVGGGCVGCAIIAIFLFFFLLGVISVLAH